MQESWAVGSGHFAHASLSDTRTAFSLFSGTQSGIFAAPVRSTRGKRWGPHWLAEAPALPEAA
jgi:hypothetical protein